jgi:hypothetical protein
VRNAVKVKFLMSTALSGALGVDGGPGKNWLPLGEVIATEQKFSCEKRVEKRERRTVVLRYSAVEPGVRKCGICYH